MDSLTTMRSRILEITEVIEIGLQSAGVRGAAIFAIGRMHACFHCLGTTDVASGRFSMLDKGEAKSGAPMRRNQAEMLSGPVDVGRNLSKILNVRHSEIRENTSRLLTVCLTLGAV